MIIKQFCGDPSETGRAYGLEMAGRIVDNLRILVWREGYEPLPLHDAGFCRWVDCQESAISKHWPWLIEEISGVASGAGVTYEDLLLLNLRAWQYGLYGAAGESCSSLAITLKNGNAACTGALDDSAELYCGPVRFVPSHGYSFVTLPITGTSWGNRGMNSAGLSLGESSLLLPGLQRQPGTINQDLAVRAILQTCASVKDVREFCRAHPFTLNLVCVDTGGSIFCAQQTSAGLLEVPAPDGYAALTNHAIDKFAPLLTARGASDFPEGDTTRARMARLLDFAQRRNLNASAEEVRDFIGRRDDSDPGSINNRGTICLTFSEPQTAGDTIWMKEPGDDDFTAVSVLEQNADTGKEDV